MIVFQVTDMTCGHCVGTVTRALKAVDRDARIDVDLGQHRVTIDSAQGQAEAFRSAIVEAGYTPIELRPAAPAETASPRKGSCCGCCGH